MRTPATLIALPLAVLGMVLAGCSGSDVPGTPTAQSTGTTTAGTTAEETTSSAAPGGESVEAIDFCAALESLPADFGVTETSPQGDGRCDARTEQRVGISVQPRDDKGIDQATGAGQQEISDTTIGSRKAKLIKKGASDTLCAVAVEVTATSRVDFAATTSTSLDTSCDVATRVATAIEPTLPK